MKLLSLCTGYGGLDLAVEEFFGAELIGCADIDKSASIAIEKHFGVPNYGDIRNVLDLDLEFDILTAGYPCQPFSHAGQRKGMEDERHIWPIIAQIIGKFRPGLVVLENVRGHLSLGFKEVLKDLATLGYDGEWRIVRASDVGAPHQRARLFIIAYPHGQTRQQPRRTDRTIRSTSSEIINRADRQKPGCGCENVSYTNDTGGLGNVSGSSRGHDSCCQSDKNLQHTNTHSFGQPLGKNGCSEKGNQGKSQFESAELGKISGDTNSQQLSANREMQKLGWRFDTRFEMSMRSIPDPLVDGKLNTKFVEYMMGLPEGWVTDLPISRAQQFKLLGNGVVPQQAYFALEQLWRHAV